MALTSFSAFGLAIFLVASATVAAISVNFGTAFAQDDRLWYVGEGAKQDMWVKYQVQEFDTNNGRPFDIVIYFKEQQGGDWIAPIYVLDEGKVIQGTLKLGSNLAPISTGMDVPDEMNAYLSGYRGSLQWLEAFSPQTDPKSLDQISWGKLACIGCEEIKPLGQEKITVTGGTFDTTIVGWHKSTNSNIWIANGFPYPIKAQTYADVTTGQAPTLFAFELLGTGMGQPDVPISNVKPPVPPLSQTTARGTYDVTLDWEPIEILPGSTIVFGVTMKEHNGFPLERVSYDFTVKDSSGNVIKEFKNQNSELGTGTHEVTFENAGSASVTVTLLAISGVPAGGGTFTESATFDIVVVPEFPLGAALVAAAVIGTLVFLTRSKMAGIGGLFGARNAL